MTRGGADTSETGVDLTPVHDAWAHRDELLLYARRLLGAQGELAEDIVQEAYLRLHERAASGSPVREARPWLFRVTRNLALDERRRSRRGDAVRASLEVVAAEQSGPHEVIQGREEAREALRGLGSLPPRERRTVILDQAGLPPPAIAHLMQTTTNAVHQSLLRARRRLRGARAAAWGLLPLPLIRLAARAATSPALDRLPALTPGSGGRFAGGAGLAGLVAAALVGGGVVPVPPVVPHPTHVRAPAAERATASPATPIGTQGAGGDDPAHFEASVPTGVVVVRAKAAVPVSRRPPSRALTSTATAGAPTRSTKTDDAPEEGVAPDREESEIPEAPDSDERPSTEPREPRAGDEGSQEAPPIEEPSEDPPPGEPENETVDPGTPAPTTQPVPEIAPPT